MRWTETKMCSDPLCSGGGLGLRGLVGRRLGLLGRPPGVVGGHHVGHADAEADVEAADPQKGHHLMHDVVSANSEITPAAQAEAAAGAEGRPEEDPSTAALAGRNDGGHFDGTNFLWHRRKVGILTTAGTQVC